MKSGEDKHAKIALQTRIISIIKIKRNPEENG